MKKWMIENAVYIGWEMRLLIINQITLIGSNKMKHNMNSIMPCMEINGNEEEKDLN